MNTRKRGAIIERPIPYARHVVRNRDIRKRVAMTKRIIPYARHAVRDRNTRKRGAIIERSIINQFYVIMYHKLSYDVIYYCFH